MKSKIFETFGFAKGDDNVFFGFYKIVFFALGRRSVLRFKGFEKAQSIKR